MDSTPYTWVSPGGVYSVPPAFRSQFLAEFPDYRIRWSLKASNWHIEQKCGRGALPPFRISEVDDSLIRARDGYWLVMTISGGATMACPECGLTLQVPFRRNGEAICGECRKRNRDGRHRAAYWPFDEALMETLRWSDPLRGGTRRASAAADASNAAIIAESARRRSDAVASLDQVDYRWLTGIGSSSALSRRVDETTFR